MPTPSYPPSVGSRRPGFVWWLLTLSALLAADAATAGPGPASASPAWSGPAWSGPAWSEPAEVVYRPPVDAPVVDPFRPPDHPYGPGNRGLEYDTTPGSAVTAAAAGTVVFAGQVAGSLHVTVMHPDGIRTTYAFLAAVAVSEGQAVESGEVVGTAADALHFSARVGDVYIDPALLFASSTPVVRLVPDAEAPAALLAPGLVDLVLERVDRTADVQATGPARADTAPASTATPDWLRQQRTRSGRAPSGDSVVTVRSNRGAPWPR